MVLRPHAATYTGRMPVPSLVVRSLVAAVAVTFALALSSCKAVSPDALPAAQAWLALVDDAQYAQSWAEAASFFKGKVDAATWEKMVTSVRGPLGKVQSRVMKTGVATSHLPDAPEGEYVVFIFETTFDNKRTVETVTPMLDTDGKWRVSGYFVRPAP